MSKWIQSEINFGKSKENTTLRFQFKLKDATTAIQKTVGSCGCTALDFNKGKGELNVKLNINRIPPQVQGIMPVSKTITVYYEDGTTEVLYLKGTVTR